MKRKVFCILLAMTMVVTLIPVAAFANEIPDNAEANDSTKADSEKVVVNEFADAEAKADFVENMVASESISDNIIEEKDSYNVMGEYDSIEIPKDGGKPLLAISDTGEEGIDPEIIGINLPDITNESNAKMAGDGTVIYDTDEAAYIAVQALEETIQNEEFQAIRAMVTITDASAPKEYEFKFNLPDGYYLVSDYDIDNEYDQYDCGAVFVANSEGRLCSTIEPAWAIDSCGNPVNTEYTIAGNTLIQKVDFDENSKFPIVADPKHVSKTKVFKKLCIIIKMA